jgi:predicted HTH domain antitoxin
MAFSILLNLPPELETKLRDAGMDVEHDVVEAYALELFRRGTITTYDLSQILGLDRYDTYALLKRRNIYEGSLTREDLEQQYQMLKEVYDRVRR